MPCHAIPHHSRPCHTILGIATMQYSPIITDAKSFGLPIYTSCTSHLQIITLHCTTQHCATLTYIKRQCITSHDTTLHCIALHCIDMHCHALACIACAPHCNKIHYIPSIQRRYTTLYYEYLTVHCTALGWHCVLSASFHWISCHTIPYHTVPYHTTPDHSMPCHTTQTHTHTHPTAALAKHFSIRVYRGPSNKLE